MFQFSIESPEKTEKKKAEKGWFSYWFGGAEEEEEEEEDEVHVPEDEKGTDCNSSLTLPMLRLLLSKAQGCIYF